MLRIAMVHYHLRGGGVTRVIEHALSALADMPVRCVVLSGEAPDSGNEPASHYHVVEGMAYGHGEEDKYDPDRLADQLYRKARSSLDGEPDLWHIHNHSLGKNAAATVAFLQLAEEFPVLFQIHDFAEDGRPSNYRYLNEMLADQRDRLYPCSSHIHYALLNRRDQRHLQQAGFPTERLHLLENPVDFELPVESAEVDQPDFLPSDKKLVLYPTRAIRRKNLGEMLLWAALAGETHHFATTLAPKNPRQQPIYETWKQFAADMDLPVTFEAGLKWQGPFTSLLQSAEALLTTSIAEGFGLAFLEPWLVGRPVVGRNLSTITDGFRETGVELPYLYDRLSVPTYWLDTDRLQHDLIRAISGLYRDYGLKLTEEHRDWMINQLMGGGHIDFGVLGEEHQRDIIRRLAQKPSDQKWMDPPRLLPESFDRELIEQNRRLISEHYALDAYGDRLYDLYQQIGGTDVKPLGYVSPSKVLQEFLSPTEFSMLRS